MKRHALLLASTWLAAASAQLVVPDLQPAFADNFHLFAHAYHAPGASLDTSIEDWEVTSSPRDEGRAATLVLSEPASNGSSAAEAFFFNSDSLSVQAGRAAARRGLVLARRDNRWALRLEPGAKGTSNVGVTLQPDGPQLDYQRGRFYACERGGRVELFWRHELDERALAPSCVDVALYAVPARGPPRKSAAVVSACVDVRGGRCMFPVR